MWNSAGQRAAATPPNSGASCENQGFDGGYDIVRRWAIRRRALDAAVNSRTRPLPSWRVPSSRRAARLLTTPGEALTQADRRFIDTLNALSPEIRIAAEAVNAFCRMVRERDAAALDAWLTTARSTTLRGFVAGLISDIGAVRAALSQPGATVRSRVGQPAQAAEAADVWSRQLRSLAQPRSARRVMAIANLQTPTLNQPAPQTRMNRRGTQE